MQIEHERDLAYQTMEQRVIERTQEIEQRRRVAASLRDILALLNSNQPLDDVLEFIVSRAVDLLHSDAGLVCQVHDSPGQCTIQAYGGLIYESGLHTALPPGWRAIYENVHTRQPVALTDRAVLLEYEPDADHDFHAMLAVPLIIKDEVYGFLVLYYFDPREFEPEPRELAMTFGDQVALAIENARLRLDSRRMAAMEERNRLARELHDVVSQTLWSASLVADVLPDLWERDMERGQAKLQQLRQLNRTALAEMRALLLELRPQSLTGVGLGELIKQLADTITMRSGLKIALDVNGTGTLAPETQMALYRIVQEALNNVLRHAQATQVTLQMGSDDDTLMLCITDDGVGFDPQQTHTGHFGLKIMTERAEAIGAQLHIESQPGFGTTIQINCPAN
ncbi:MAG: GAF domain-containing sensor histidine kinase [Acidobacteriales bacterium]|nr:GAF domain-containing sensor histidine kinase [Terriglobales bacterium]